MKVTGIVLAAGESRRMGQQKLLMKFAGKPLITHVVDAVQASVVDEVLVVTGGHHDEVKATLGGSVRYVRNPDPSRGMRSSVRCGLEAVQADTIAVAIFLGDQPRIEPPIINAVLDAFCASKKTIAVPEIAERRGHPLVFDLVHRDEVLAAFDDTGLRGLPRSHPKAVLTVSVDSAGVLEDVDTPEDFRELEG